MKCHYEWSVLRCVQGFGFHALLCPFSVSCVFPFGLTGVLLISQTVLTCCSTSPVPPLVVSVCVYSLCLPSGVCQFVLWALCEAPREVSSCVPILFSLLQFDLNFAFGCTLRFALFCLVFWSSSLLFFVPKWLAAALFISNGSPVTIFLASTLIQRGEILASKDIMWIAHAAVSKTAPQTHGINSHFGTNLMSFHNPGQSDSRSDLLQVWCKNTTAMTPYHHLWCSNPFNISWIYTLLSSFSHSLSQ